MCLFGEEAVMQEYSMRFVRVVMILHVPFQTRTVHCRYNDFWNSGQSNLY